MHLVPVVLNVPRTESSDAPWTLLFLPAIPRTSDLIRLDHGRYVRAKSVKWLYTSVAECNEDQVFEGEVDGPDDLAVIASVYFKAELADDAGRFPDMLPVLEVELV